MAKSLRSKSKRHFRTVRRQQLAGSENIKLQKICHKLGTATEEVEMDEPKRFSFTAPLDENRKPLPEVTVWESRKQEEEEWEVKEKEKLQEIAQKEEDIIVKKIERRLSRRKNVVEGEENVEQVLKKMKELKEKKAEKGGRIGKPKKFQNKKRSFGKKGRK